MSSSQAAGSGLRPVLFLVGVAAIELGLIGILLAGDLRESMPVFFACYGLAFGGYLWAVGVRQQPSLRVIIGLGILFRLTSFGAAPTLSDDIYRYVWDGRVQAGGTNPYRYAPANEALLHLRDSEIYPKINHRSLHTIYPPLAQLLFRISHTVWPSVWSVKLFVAAFDVLCAWFLIGLLRLFDQDARNLLFYFWHPLLLIEGSGNGHIDVVAVALMMAAIRLVVTKPR